MTEETGMKGGPRMGCGARAGGIVALAVIAAVAGVIVPASAQMPPGFGVPSDPFRSEIPVADPDRSGPDGQPESKPDSKRDSKRDHRHRRPMPPPPPGVHLQIGGVGISLPLATQTTTTETTTVWGPPGTTVITTTTGGMPGGPCLAPGQVVTSTSGALLPPCPPLDSGRSDRIHGLPPRP